MESNWRMDAWRYGQDPLELDLAARILSGPFAGMWVVRSITPGQEGVLGALLGELDYFYSYFIFPFPIVGNFPGPFEVGPD